MNGDRTLSDGDVKAIVEELADVLEERLSNKFYRDIGQGTWGMIKKGLFALACFLAAYGYMKYGGGNIGGQQ